MRWKFSINHLLVLSLIVAIGLALQLGLNKRVSKARRDVENVESAINQDLILKIANEFPKVVETKYATSIGDVDLRCNPSIVDYCLFRREIDCSYNLNIAHLHWEIAHSRIPVQNRIDGVYVDVPLEYRAQQKFRVLATPFGITIEKQ